MQHKLSGLEDPYIKGYIDVMSVECDNNTVEVLLITGMTDHNIVARILSTKFVAQGLGEVLSFLDVIVVRAISPVDDLLDYVHCILHCRGCFCHSILKLIKDSSGGLSKNVHTVVIQSR